MRGEGVVLSACLLQCVVRVPVCHFKQAFTATASFCDCVSSAGWEQTNGGQLTSYQTGHAPLG